MVNGLLRHLHSGCTRLRPGHLWKSTERRWSSNGSMGVVHWQCDGLLHSQFRYATLPHSIGRLANLRAVAELVSAYPTAGGMYFVTKHVVPSEHVALWAWVIGWCNFLGQAAGVASLAYTVSQMILATASMNSTQLDDGSYSFAP